MPLEAGILARWHATAGPGASRIRRADDPPAAPRRPPPPGRASPAWAWRPTRAPRRRVAVRGASPARRRTASHRDVASRRVASSAAVRSATHRLKSRDIRIAGTAPARRRRIAAGVVPRTRTGRVSGRRRGGRIPAVPSIRCRRAAPRLGPSADRNVLPRQRLRDRIAAPRRAAKRHRHPRLSALPGRNRTAPRSVVPPRRPTNVDALRIACTAPRCETTVVQPPYCVSAAPRYDAKPRLRSPAGGHSAARRGDTQPWLCVWRSADRSKTLLTVWLYSGAYSHTLDLGRHIPVSPIVCACSAP